MRSLPLRAGGSNQPSISLRATDGMQSATKKCRGTDKLDLFTFVNLNKITQLCFRFYSSLRVKVLYRLLGWSRPLNRALLTAAAARRGLCA